MIDIQDIVGDIAAAVKAIDARKPIGRSRRFRPGVGPLTESELTDLLAAELRSANAAYSKCGGMRYPQSSKACDLVVPGAWALELKLARPFGDNGKPAERWSENVLYPYPGNTSSIGDCLKLLESGFSERKGVVVIGYEHVPAVIPIEPAIRGFEILAEQVAGIGLSSRATACVDGLIHPHHQRAYIHGWEVLERRSGASGARDS